MHLAGSHQGVQAYFWPHQDARDKVVRQCGQRPEALCAEALWVCHCLCLLASLSDSWLGGQRCGKPDTLSASAQAEGGCPLSARWGYTAVSKSEARTRLSALLPVGGTPRADALMVHFRGRVP